MVQVDLADGLPIEPRVKRVSSGYARPGFAVKRASTKETARYAGLVV